MIHSPAFDPDAPGEVILAFPHLDAAAAGATLDAALSDARQKPVRQVACWSLLPTQPPDLAARLVARGFQWGWQPHWMALDLEQGEKADLPVPDGLQVFLDDGSAWDVDGLPYRSHRGRSPESPDRANTPTNLSLWRSPGR